MSLFKFNSDEECEFDLISLGEVMLRLDPGDMRIHSTRQFNVWEGGGEYNVARGIRRCFGLKSAVVTALAENSIGKLVEDLILQGGVSPLIQWFDYDGIGRKVRNGLNFTERGFGLRGAKGVSDRGHTAVSQLKPGSVDWNTLFKKKKTKWFHTGGIFAALSETTPEVALEAMKAAKVNDVIVSYDLNYRPSLWKDFGGKEKAKEVNHSLAPFVDVMIGNEEDFVSAMGFELKGEDENFKNLKTDNFKSMIQDVVKEFPNFKVIATTLRTVVTASINDWGAIAYSDGNFVQANHREAVEIFDRVGGGDSFASGLIYGLLQGKPLAEAIEYGAAHGALAMTTPGDTSMASLTEVENLLGGGSLRVDR